MTRRQLQGFTLIELVVVILIVAGLLAIGVPYLARMRANTAINFAAERMQAEVQQAQSAARGFGLRQARNGAALAAPLALGSADAPDGGVVYVRLMQSRAGDPDSPREVNRWEVGPVASIPIRVQNIPNGVPLDDNADEGTLLEIGTGQGAAFVALGGLPIQPDGTILTDGNTDAVILIGRPNDHQYQLQVFPSGKLQLRKL